jgi:hypothetical protein
MIEQNTILFYEYLTHAGNKLKDYTPNVMSNTNYVAVIFETRKDEYLESIMKNTLYYLNETNSNIKWGLQIFHGTENEDYVKSITKNWGNVKLNNIGLSSITKLEYSELMKTSQFWKQINGEKVLIFQSDSILLRSGIDEFLEYDYIGAPWRKPKENKMVGNGGLSLRTVSKMIEICDNYKDEELMWEDIYFVKYLDKGLADIEAANKFSMEDVYSPNPLGVHLPIKHIETYLLKEVLFKN